MSRRGKEGAENAWRVMEDIKMMRATCMARAISAQVDARDERKAAAAWRIHVELPLHSHKAIHHQ
jgi:hypothetical protein